MKEKNEKSVSRKNKKTFRDQALLQKSHQRNTHLSGLSDKILGTIVKIDKGGTQTDPPKDKKIDDYAQSLTSEG